MANTTGRAPADVLIDGEKIAAVLAPGSNLLGFEVERNIDRVIDARGSTTSIVDFVVQYAGESVLERYN